MIAVLGLGFAGLTVALGFAEKGMDVYGVEIDTFRADLIRKGKIPYYEPGLDDALARHLNDRFHVVTDIDDIPDEIECFFICVGTPPTSGGEPDYTSLFHAISEIVDAGFEGYRTVVIKTSMLPGTMDKVILPYFETRGVEPGIDMGVAYNPDFMREGKSWGDFTKPARIVLGVTNPADEATLRRCYEPFGAPIVPTSYATAEFIRYMSSTLLATMISYSNEMARAAKTIGGIDIAQAFRIAQMDGRWSDNTMRGYVYPGCGFGGIFLPKDTRDFIELVKFRGSDTPLLETVMDINNALPGQICDEILEKVPLDAKVGILGLTFKEGSSDVRNSASARIIDALIGTGYRDIYAYDPIANDMYAAEYKQDIRYCFSVKEICDTCDAIVIATPWRQFRVVEEHAKGKTIIDCRYML